MHANYKRIHVDETAQVEKEEVAWVMEGKMRALDNDTNSRARLVRPR